MAIRKILNEEEPILRKISKPVTIFDKNLKDLFADMDETMIKNDGTGIAAVQVGILKRMFIVADRKEKVFVVNPEIISQSGHYKSLVEGCLSLPGKVGLVDRPNEIVARFQDPDGNVIERKFVGWIAKAFSHEYDHLDGILYRDKAEKMFDSYEEYDKYKKQQDAAKNKDDKNKK